MFAEIAVHTPMARRLLGGARSETGPSGGGARSETGPSGGNGAGGAALGITFHYRVPAHLAETLRPGHLVWVPFGREELHGVVLALTDDALEGVRTRPLLALVLPDPVLTPAQLDLARWLSNRTLTPILDCLLLMLPTGLAQKAEPVLELTDEGRRVLHGEGERGGEGDAGQLSFGTADFVEALHDGPYFAQLPGLKGEQHALLAYLLAHEPTPERVLARLEGDLSRRSLVDPLIERGLLTRQRRIIEPPLKPKTGKQVALAANQETIEQTLPTLGRQSKQADVLAWLVEAADPAPALAAVCAAVGCTASPVRSLETRGWLRIEADKTVTLLLPPDQVRRRLIELRGGEKYQRVLEALAGEAGPVWVGWLYAETDTDLTTLRELAAAGLISLSESEIWRDPLAGKVFVADTPPALTEDQARVWAEIKRSMRNDEGGTMNDESGLRTPDFGTHRSSFSVPHFLLHGVTGSGKTEIYLRAIQAALDAGQQAIALVPEIALTPQTVRRFAARFGDRVTVYHSELSPGERYDVWRKARAGQVQVVVGARSALFLPLPNLGLIVLDEEHDPSYKESQRSPRYHARDAALQLARLTGATLLLGSATPALESFYAAQLGQIRLIELPRRIMGHAKAIAEQQKQLHLRQTVYRPMDALHPETRYAELPPVQVIDLRQELRAGNRSMFSRALQEALERVLAAGQQAILFLNRRGTATFVICRDCGHVLNCEHCDVPLTYHEAGVARSETGHSGAGAGVARSETGQSGVGAGAGVARSETGHSGVGVARSETGHSGAGVGAGAGVARAETGQSRGYSSRGVIICHHCGRRAAEPDQCPQCASRRIRYLGAGTEKIAEQVSALWPQARVVRWDRDVTGAKGSHDAILDQFASRQADVMVGTQMIAKGLDLPLVTLVGVINADVGLYLPDFRAAERSFQLLTQVAGRAGRSLLGGQVIVQSYRPEHYAIQAARRHDYLDFSRQELSYRRELGYPPFRRLARLIYIHQDRERAKAEAEALARGLRFAIQERGAGNIDLIGPAPCFFGREQGKYRWHLVVRAPDPAAFLRTFDLPAGWRVDVDPVSLL
jgi:primosomal protein N' (replication factor Y)